MGGLQATRPLQGTTAETTELHTQAQVTGEGYQHECWLGPPARQQSTPSPQRTEHGCAARARGPREWSGLGPQTTNKRARHTRVFLDASSLGQRHSKHFLERGVTPHRTVQFPVVARRQDLVSRRAPITVLAPQARYTGRAVHVSSDGTQTRSPTIKRVHMTVPMRWRSPTKWWTFKV